MEIVSLDVHYIFLNAFYACKRLSTVRIQFSKTWAGVKPNVNNCYTL